MNQNKQKITLTDEQINALKIFREKYGRCWKYHLIKIWDNGKDDQVPAIGMYLRQIRNLNKSEIFKITNLYFSKKNNGKRFCELMIGSTFDLVNPDSDQNFFLIAV